MMLYSGGYDLLFFFDNINFNVFKVITFSAVHVGKKFSKLNKVEVIFPALMLSLHRYT